MDKIKDIVGNKIIAEFIGAKLIMDDNLLMGYELPEGYPIYYKYYEPEALKFNSSWDWLMPVLDKIEQYKYSDGDTAFLRSFSSGDQGYMVRINRSQLFTDKERIKAAWLAVVDFIQWFNNQNK